MKFNWDQTGMPVSLVSRLGQRNEFAEFKSVLSDARNQILSPVDVESMARQLVESGGRDFVDMVRALSTELADARRELEAANRRYGRMVAELAERGIAVDDFGVSDASGPSVPEPVAADDGLAEWEEWDRRFRALLG